MSFDRLSKTFFLRVGSFLLRCTVSLHGHRRPLRRQGLDKPAPTGAYSLLESRQVVENIFFLRCWLAGQVDNFDFFTVKMRIRSCIAFPNSFLWFLARWTTSTPPPSRCGRLLTEQLPNVCSEHLSVREEEMLYREQRLFLQCLGLEQQHAAKPRRGKGCDARQWCTYFSRYGSCFAAGRQFCRRCCRKLFFGRPKRPK